MPYRVRTEFTGMQGSPWLNTMFFSDTAGSAQQAVTAVGAFWGAVDALIDNEVNWATEPDVPTLNANTGAVSAVTSTTPASGTGGTAGDSLPPVTQGLVRWRTGVFPVRRERRGRTFIPALTELANDNGQLLAASRTTIQTAADALIADVNSALVIWSRPDNVPPTNGDFSVVTAASVWTNFAELRSRRD